MGPSNLDFRSRSLFALSLVLFAAGLFFLVLSIGMNNSAVLAATPCQLKDVPFAVGLSRRDPIFAVDPTFQSPPVVFEIDGGIYGTISTSRDALCEQPSAPDGGAAAMPNPCIEMDAFTFGLDWVPLLDGEGGDGAPDLSVYELNPLDGSVGNETGWGILYVEREGAVHALGWGSELSVKWPGALNSTLVELDAQTPTLTGAMALYPASKFQADGKARLAGLDFNSWVLGKGQTDVSHCFTPPVQANSPVRIYFSIPPRPGFGDGGQVHWIMPLYDGQSWSWSSPEVLCNGPIPGLVPMDNIDALSYQPPMNGADGFLIFSLDEEVEPTGSEFERGEPFYGVSVAADGNGNLHYGHPRPIRPRGGVPLRDIVGRDTRGVCTTDPRFLARNERPCTCGSPRE